MARDNHGDSPTPVSHSCSGLEQRERIKEKLLNVPVDGVKSLDTVLRFNPGAAAIQFKPFSGNRRKIIQQNDDHDYCDRSYSKDTKSNSRYQTLQPFVGLSVYSWSWKLIRLRQVYNMNIPIPFLMLPHQPRTICMSTSCGIQVPGIR